MDVALSRGMSGSGKLVFPGRIWGKTEVFLLARPFRIRLSIEGAAEHARRRALALAITRRIVDLIGPVSFHWIQKAGSGRGAIYNQFERGINFRHATDLSTTNGRLGHVIRMRRLERGWSQRELARRAGICRTHLIAIEKGRHTPGDVVVHSLEQALDATLRHWRDWKPHNIPIKIQDSPTPEPGLR